MADPRRHVARRVFDVQGRESGLAAVWDVACLVTHCKWRAEGWHSEIDARNAGRAHVLKEHSR